MTTKLCVIYVSRTRTRTREGGREEPKDDFD